MNWLDDFQKHLPTITNLLSIMVNTLKLREYYNSFRQWLRNGKRQNFWLGFNRIARVLVNVHMAALIIFLGSAVAEHWGQNYSPLMPAVGLIHLCWFIFGGVSVSGLTIKGLWHYNMKLANL